MELHALQETGKRAHFTGSPVGMFFWYAAGVYADSGGSSTPWSNVSVASR